MTGYTNWARWIENYRKAEEANDHPWQPWELAIALVAAAFVLALLTF